MKTSINAPFDEYRTDMAMFTANTLDGTPLMIPDHTTVAVATTPVSSPINPGPVFSPTSASGSPVSGESPAPGPEGDGSDPEFISTPATNQAPSGQRPNPAPVTPTPETKDPNVYHLLLTGNRNGRYKQVIGHAKVLDDEFTREVLVKKTWHQTRAGYPATNIRDAAGKVKRKLLHHLVFEHYFGSIPPGKEIDHEDRCTTNSVPGNLRAVTRSENSANKGLTRKNRSGFVGVSRHKKRGVWVACIKKDNRQIYLGSFTDPTEAARRVNVAYGEHYPRVAVPNPHAELRLNYPCRTTLMTPN